MEFKNKELQEHYNEVIDSFKGVEITKEDKEDIRELIEIFNPDMLE